MRIQDRTRRRRPPVALLGALLLAPSDLEAGERLEAARGRYRSQLQQLRDENREMKAEMAEMKAMLRALMAGTAGAAGPASATSAAGAASAGGATRAAGAAASPGPSTPPPPPTATEPPSRQQEAPLTEEERALMEEFAEELGAETGGSSPDLDSPFSSRGGALGPGSPSVRDSPPWDQRNLNSQGRRNFWGTGGLPGQSNILDIGLASEFIASRATERTAVSGDELSDKLSLRETELAIGGYVDPYHRADVLLVWNALEDHVELEEGFLTFFNLPEGWRARVGKFRSRTGLTNALHLADLPWVNYPKVVTTFLGEEGFAQAGARLTYIGEPRGKFSWSTDLEAFNGDSENIVDPLGLIPGGYDPDASSDDIIRSARLEGNWQFDDTRDLRLGVFGFDADSDRVKLRGLDATWRDLRQPGRNEWLVRFEGMKQERSDLAAIDPSNPDRIGWYTWLNRRMDRNHEAGLRLEKQQMLMPGALDVDSWAAYFTYYPTEFSWYRFQYQEDDLNGLGVTDRKFLVQFRWQIGVDRHALQ